MKSAATNKGVWFGALYVAVATGAMALMILQGTGNERSGSDEVVLPRRSEKTVSGHWRSLSWKTRPPVGQVSYTVDVVGEPETEAPGIRPDFGPRKEVLRTLPIGQLPVSPEFLRRLENETADRPPSQATLSGGGTGRISPQPAAGELTPGSYRVVSFAAGETRSGKPIRAGSDIEKLQSHVGFPPDYSLDTTAPLKDRLLSLGHGGVVILEVVGGFLVDGPGPDLVVFENPFVVSGTNGREVYAETAAIGAAEENLPDSYHEFPCLKDERPYRGCAGVVPVRYASGLDLESVGGDLFDLGALGLTRAKFIRIRDTGDNQNSFLEGTEGFDLDAVGLLHTEREQPPGAATLSSGGSSPR